MSFEGLSMAVFLGSCLSQGKLNIVSNRLHPSQTSETVTRDTYSLPHPPPKPQKPLHVTHFPLSSQTPETVTRDTFSSPHPTPKPQKPLHAIPFPLSSQTPETVTRVTFSLPQPSPKPKKPLHVMSFPYPSPKFKHSFESQNLDS